MPYLKIDGQPSETEIGTQAKEWGVEAGTLVYGDGPEDTFAVAALYVGQARITLTRQEAQGLCETLSGVIADMA